MILIDNIQHKRTDPLIAISLAVLARPEYEASGNVQLTWINSDVSHCREEKANNSNQKLNKNVNIERNSELHKGKNKLNIHIETATATTRLWVSRSWCLRWRRIAKNLSTLRATTLKKEVKENILNVIAEAKWMLHPAYDCCNHFTRSEMYNGWPNTPTPTSETETDSGAF